MKRDAKKRQIARGFTLVELLVVIAIIGVLVAMTMPALMASREAGRRNLCTANMAQIMLAMQSYESAFELWPSGVVNPDGPIRNQAQGLHQGWILHLLPYLDEQVAYEKIDFKESVYAPANEAVRAYWPRVLICPSESNDVPGTSNYAGCHNDVEAPINTDNHGALFLNSQIRRDDVTDGLAHTLFVSEKRVFDGDLGWMSGTRATLRNTGLPLNNRRDEVALQPAEPDCQKQFGTEAELLYVGGFASAHPSGANVGFGDASVEFISEDIDLKLWQQLGNRADGNLSTLPTPAP
jgi:prepilin-type N-terminal cleavage/methylation domain-containing protein/prepilin-type processing-associated H-X9-DG protein